jgi:tetratricopeptide (TPR) repeat protein
MELRKLLILFCSVFFSLALIAQSSFDNGIKAYEENRYSEAIDHFTKHIETYPYDYLSYFNLGNSYYKQKQYPYALWAFSKSLKIKPNFVDAQVNSKLSFEKSGIQGEWKQDTALLSRSFFSVHKNLWAMLSLTTLVLLSISLYLFFVSSSGTTKKSTFLLLSGIFLFSTLFFTTTAYLHRSHLQSNSEAIIIVATANAKASPKNEDKTLFSVPGGHTVRVLRENNEWIEIETSAASVGWIPKNELKRF